MQAGIDRPTRRRFLVSRVVFVCGLLLFAGILLGIATTAFITWLGENLAAGLANGVGLQSEANPQWTYPLVALIGFIILPVVLFAPILVPLAVSWKNPRRIVVFRRFHERQENRALQSIARRHLSPYGHVFTLADDRIHESLFVRVPLLLGQLNFLNFRLQRVRDAKGVMKLRQVLERRWRLNLNWLLSPRKIFPIHTSDEYWQTCVSLLLEDADLVVMDVSNFSTAMAWEIAECGRRNLLQKAVLLTRGESAGDEDRMLVNLETEIGVGRAAIFTHNKARINSPIEMHKRIAAILADSKAVASGATSWQVFATIAANLALSVTLAAATFALTAPYLFPEWTAYHSPSRAQVLTAYYRNSNLAYLDRLVKNDWVWTHAQLRLAASTGTGIEGTNAIRAIGRWGDEGDIPLLVELIARRNASKTDAERMQGLLRWGYLEEEALTELSIRLGRRALPPLLDAIAGAPVLGFDKDLNGDLYLKYIEPNATAEDDPLFVRLLTCPNQAGRFIAAVHLGYRRDPRAAPALREMATASFPSGFADEANELLGRLQARR